jgi:hypothetical protein
MKKGRASSKAVNTANTANTANTSEPVAAPVAAVPVAAAPVATVNVVDTQEQEKKKRGRKKTPLVVEVEAPLVVEVEAPLVVEVEAPIVEAPIVEAPIVEAPIVVVKKKRAKKQSATSECVSAPLEPTLTIIPDTPDAAQVQEEEPHSAVPVHKKRGRKPKGGKVIQHLAHENVMMHDAPNIILHLKCSVSDIPDLTSALSSEISIKPGDVVSFNALETKGADLNDSYHCSNANNSSNSNSNNNSINNNNNNNSGSNLANKPKPTPDALIATNSYNYLNNDADEDDDDDDTGSNDNNLKDIWKKLHHLKLCFHKSDVFQNIGAGTRRSCCFWDTCEFDTPPVYLPKCIAPNGGYNVYGCFCSPECALAYLMNEGVDTSVKFERCQMLNSMYGKLLNYEKSIKPAPNAQYILNKFYGNLSIQEYRKLFKSEQIVYVVNKPLTHILPEMYEDNNDFLLNNKVIPNNNYKLKKKTSGFS